MKQRIITPLTINPNAIEDPDHIAHVFNQHFTNIVDTLKTSFPPGNNCNNMNSLRYFDREIDLSPSTPEEVATVIGSIDPKSTFREL